MKRLVSFAALAAMVISAVAQAAVIQLTPSFGSPATVLDTFYIQKNGTGVGGSNGNNSTNQLYRLNTYFLGTPFVPTASLKPATQTFDWSAGGLAGWDYAVIHYGGGAHGGAGGSIGAWSLNGMSSFTFPSASFSSIDFFKKAPNGTVPDGGTTLVSLGIALIGLGSIRKFLASNS